MINLAKIKVRFNINSEITTPTYRFTTMLSKSVYLSDFHAFLCKIANFVWVFYDVLRTSLARNSHFGYICIPSDIFEEKNHKWQRFWTPQNWSKNGKFCKFFEFFLKNVFLKGFFPKTLFFTTKNIFFVKNVFWEKSFF